MKKWKPPFFCLILFVMGCNEDGTDSPMSLSLSQNQGQCSSRSNSELLLVTEQNQISLKGTILTPDPCHKLEAEVRRQENTIFAKITPLNLNQVCIQCIGEVSFETSLGRFDPGAYTVKVLVIEFSSEKILLEQTVTL